LVQIEKTEAIDFTKPFLWFDDDLFDDEKEDLIKHDAVNNHINVDLYKKSDQLASFINSFLISGNIEQCNDDEELYEEAKKIAIKHDKITAGLLRKQLRTSWAKCARLVDLLVKRGVAKK
jgi:predicted HTH transcriptional regulator